MGNEKQYRCEGITMRLAFRLALKVLLLERGSMCHGYV